MFLSNLQLRSKVWNELQLEDVVLQVSQIWLKFLFLPSYMSPMCHFQGLQTRFPTLPPPSFLLSDLLLCPQRQMNLLTAVQWFLLQGDVATVLSEEHFQGFYSSLSTVPKPNGGGSTHSGTEISYSCMFKSSAQYWPGQLLPSTFWGILWFQQKSRIECIHAYSHFPSSSTLQPNCGLSLLPVYGPLGFHQSACPSLRSASFTGNTLLSCLDILLLKVHSITVRQWTVQTLQSFGWILNPQKTSLKSAHQLEHLQYLLQYVDLLVFVFLLPSHSV